MGVEHTWKMFGQFFPLPRYLYVCGLVPPIEPFRGGVGAGYRRGGGIIGGEMNYQYITITAYLI
jgi:hypothetical protein